MHLNILITIEVESEEQARQIYNRVEQKVQDIDNVQITGDIHSPAKENVS